MVRPDGIAEEMLQTDNITQHLHTDTSLQPVIGKAFFTATGDYWKKVRKMVNPVLLLLLTSRVLFDIRLVTLNRGDSHMAPSSRHLIQINHQMTLLATFRSTTQITGMHGLLSLPLSITKFRF